MPKIKISTLNALLTTLVLLLCLVLLKITFDISHQYTQLDIHTNDYIRWKNDAYTVRMASDYLTEQVRLFTQTKKREHMDNFFFEVNKVRRRDAVLENLKEHPTEKDMLNLMKYAVQNSNQLVLYENYAMKLICTAMNYNDADIPDAVRNTQLSEEDALLDAQAQINKARQMVFDNHYRATKAIIYQHIDNFLQGVLDDTQKRKQENLNQLDRLNSMQRLIISAIIALSIAIFLLILWYIARPLKLFSKCIEEYSLLPVIGSGELQTLAKNYNDIQKSYEISYANSLKYRKKAEQDALTEVINREGFQEISESLKNTTEPLALLLIDVDHFKEINDTYGHDIGDKALKKVATLLAQNFQATDYLFRLGGDEFASIVMNMRKEKYEVLKTRIEKINTLLQNPDDALPPISLSVGIAFSDQGYTNEIFKQADQALYQTKKTGRKGSTYYTDFLS